jgi:hypothetical protein
MRVVKYLKMNSGSTRVFIFMLLYMAMLLVKINALENIISSGFELTAKDMEGPQANSSIVRAPVRRPAPCHGGEKRGPNGKCRKRW